MELESQGISFHQQWPATFFDVRLHRSLDQVHHRALRRDHHMDRPQVPLDRDLEQKLRRLRPGPYPLRHASGTPERRRPIQTRQGGKGCRPAGVGHALTRPSDSRTRLRHGGQSGEDSTDAQLRRRRRRWGVGGGRIASLGWGTAFQEAQRDDDDEQSSRRSRSRGVWKYEFGGVGNDKGDRKVLK